MADASRLATIFRRGGNKQELFSGAAAPAPGEELQSHLSTLAVAWDAAKARRGIAAAVWRPQTGAFEVTHRGRVLFNGQGFMHAKKLYVHADEAAFMCDRGDLLLLLEADGGQQRLLSAQEALHCLGDLGIGLERLLVRSHLSKLGFCVARHPACWTVPPELTPAAVWQASPAWAGRDGLLRPANAVSAAELRDAQAAAAAATGPRQPKRRKLAAAAAAAAAADEQQQQQACGQQHTAWWEPVPAWLAAPQQQPSQPPQLEAAPSAGGGDGAGEPWQLPGEALQRRFPRLRPLPAYHPAQGEPLQQGQQGAAELVFDCLASQAHFSYRSPPQPQFSLAMMQPSPGAAWLPPLAELLRLLGAAAGPGQEPQQGPGQGRGLRFALPDGEGVSFLQLLPVGLMNLLTNEAS